MVTISASVGLNGVNRPNDVGKVQQLLNHNRHRIPGSREIAEDSIIGPKTIAAIERFQRVVVGMHNPDRRVDPNGKTLRLLNSGIIGNQPASQPATPPATPSSPNTVSTVLRFPLRRRPRLSYRTGARYFGARRANGRLHAGCDLIAPQGTDILAVADGEILATYAFYLGTDALEVRHIGGFVVRYGEISGLASGLRRGGQVTRGQLIAHVGRMSSGSSMLHFEMYSGTESGRLTVRVNRPYQRRADLIDPTPYLDRASLT